MTYILTGRLLRQFSSRLLTVAVTKQYTEFLTNGFEHLGVEVLRLWGRAYGYSLLQTEYFCVKIHMKIEENVVES